MAWLTRDLPGSGGVLRSDPADFVVDEIPAYEASGEGEHALVHIEKTGMTTPEAIRRVAQAFGVRDDLVGRAGLKDKHARTRQWLSIPAPIKVELPDPATLTLGDDLRVLAVQRHGNKLKRGHLRGNRFLVTVREVPLGGLERARATLAWLVAHGVPNAFGPQRFGRDGDNPTEARKILRRERPAPRDRRVRSLILSALQSDVFNRILERRIERGLFLKALSGDWMRKHGTGGIFESQDPAVDQARMDALEISPTGLMPGPKAHRCSGDAGQIEAEVLRELDLDDERLLGGLEEGTRRLLRVPLDLDARVDPGPTPDSFVAQFSLPSGAYATVVLGELIKPDSGLVLRTESVDE